MARQAGSASTIVTATPHQVWAVITDVTRTGEWSPECERVDWDGDPGAVLGARFTGQNRIKERTWSMPAEVVEVDAPRRFGFHTLKGDEPRTRWTYQLEPVDEGTRITESWERLFTPSRAQRLAEKALMGGRVDHNATNLAASLERLKQVIEASSD